MKHLIDKDKFEEEIFDTDPKVMRAGLVIAILYKHLQDIKDEPHHPSGMDNDKIKIRNELRSELRGGGIND